MFFLSELAVVCLGTYLYWLTKPQFIIIDYSVTCLVLFNAVYSTTGFIFRFSFRGQYPEDSGKNDLMRLGTMVVSILIAVLVLVS